MVANRGEIARRVIRTAKQLGWRTVALFTEPDRGAQHVREADAAIEVPSHLDIAAVVAAAREAGAGFVHPGYGFLSERAEFARALEAAGIVLVGPSAEVMDAMGRKDKAREIALTAGVPVVPSYSLTDDPATMSFPVLVKAAAGGGGKGMRVVRNAHELDEAKGAAAREAAKAFGDDTLLIEKYVESGRHIEVQVMGDHHGAVRHFFERDCSTQRRHQKVVEEAPAPTIGAAQREAITQAAVDLAAEVGYRNAGTVEFLLDNATGEFYFLEMNTRLQVEHPVTEMVTRVRGEAVDLVALQLRLARGEPIGIEQHDITLEGHAIEARVYAEDSFNGFLPQAGRAGLVEWPQGTADQRIDEALESGQVVSTGFDPMLGKVICRGATRDEARQRLSEALGDTVIAGLSTNTGFLKALVDADEFAEASIDTAWLDTHEVPAPDPAPARALAARALTPPVGRGPFAADGFRLGGPPAQLRVQLDEPVTVRRDEPLAVSGTVLPATDRVEVILEGQRHVFALPDPFGEHGSAESDGTLLAPMPGIVLDVRVAEGDRVSEGDILGVMEAMKMELSLKAPYHGTVVTVGAKQGAQVALGTVLFEVSADE